MTGLIAIVLVVVIALAGAALGSSLRDSRPTAGVPQALTQ